MIAAHRWKLAGFIVLLTAVTIGQPVVAKMFRFKRAREDSVRQTFAVTSVVEADATACNDETRFPCKIAEPHDIHLCLSVHFVSSKMPAPEIMLGDLDNDGVISASEASSVLNDKVIKKRLFAMSLGEQKNYLLCFDDQIRDQIGRLAATHGTWKWRFAIREAANMGLTAAEAETIAVAWSN